MRSLDRWAGDGSCVFCLQLYVLELEVFCADCDRAACPLCSTRTPGRDGCLCPECALAPPPGEEA